MKLKLATCTYQEFTPAMGIPIRTTVGHPRFKLSYQLAGHARLITPTRPMLGLPEDAYTLTYRRHLDAAGVDRILAELAAIAATGEPGRTLVLLCFDRLNVEGNWCHRTFFATWFQEKTGQDVPELGARPCPASPTLFD